MIARLAPLCSILLLAAAGPVALADPPTYTKDVAPILWANCAGCHRPGEVGPFSLLTYKDAARRADDLVRVTESREMPPWKPEPGFGSFHDARRLRDADLKTLADWAKAGAAEGDPKDLPPAPRFPEGWQLGQPDLVLEMPEAYTVPADGRDVQRCFVIPIPIEADRTVAAVEFRPGNRKVVHHSILYLAPAGSAKSKDEADPGPGYSSFGGPGVLPSGGLGGWAPGAMPRPLPEGTGRLLRAGNDLIMQVHYHPDGKPEVDRSVVGIYFTKAPARKIVGGIAVRSRDIDIPAGEKRHHVQAESAPLPVDATAIGITPHMHNVGREFKVVAETPDGSTTPLIWIKDWDFNWQGQYQYDKPIRLAKGTVIKVDAYYDNSEANERNPSNPPKRVRWGEQTTDEMCLVAVQVVTETNADLLALMRMRGNGLAAAIVGGAGAERPAAGAALRKAAGMLRKGAGAGAEGRGFAIPDGLKDRLARFDTNGDGRLSPAEVEAMPEPARTRIKQAIADRTGGN